MSYFWSLMRTPWRGASKVFYPWEFNISELHLSWQYMIPQSITPSGSPGPTRPNMVWPNMTSPSSVWSVAVEFLRESWRSGGPLTVLLRREASVVGWGSRGEGGGCDGWKKIRIERFQKPNWLLVLLLIRFPQCIFLFRWSQYRNIPVTEVIEKTIKKKIYTCACGCV